MSNLGMIGALGGLGKGMADVAMDSLEEAKLTRLEELRTRNNQETNKLDSEQRHGYAVQEADIQHGYRTTEQEAGNKQDLDKLKIQNDYSLSQLAQENADQTSRMEKLSNLRNEEKTNDRSAYEDILDDDGKTVIGQRDTKTGKLDYFSGSDKESFEYKPVYEEDTTLGTKKVIGYQQLGKQGTQGKFIPAGQAGPDAGGGDVIQKILAANPGKDEAWAQRYMEHLKAQGKL